MSLAADARAAVGFFSRIPVGATSPDLRPAVVLGLGPLVGAVLGALAALAALPAGAGPLGAAVAWAVLAWLTRGLHLDGLADCADGLGSAAPPERAVEIMHRSDIGPFGVVAIVAAAAVQITALAAAPTWPVLAAMVVTGAVLGRAAAVLLAVRGLPAAVGSRLGAWVAGSIPASAAAAVLLAAVALGSMLALAAGLPVPAVVAAGMAAAGAALWWRRTARQRFGGVTGDVFGAAVETSATLVLLLLAIGLRLG